MFEKLANSTFRIVCGHSSGSGFSYRLENIIITNCHVIENTFITKQEIYAITEDNISFLAKLIAYSSKEEYDFAILEIQSSLPKNRNILQPNLELELKRGIKTVFSGFPHGIPDLLIHEAIISKEDWQSVQDKLNSRRWQQGRNKTYKFTGLLKCQHCGSTLKRQVSYKKKIVWCCSKYIKEGKVACQGMRVPEVDISNWVITSPVTVIERDGNEEKYYSYSGQESEDQRSSSGQEENQSSRILSSVHRPRRTAIKL